MIIEKKMFLFSSARVILDDSALIEAVRSKRYSYVTGISYHVIDFGGIYVSVKSKKTILISIKRPIDTIFNDFTASARNEVRHTFNDPKFTFVCDDRNYEAVYALYRDFERAQGRTPFGKSVFLGCKVFSAYYDHELISCVICYDSPPYLRSRANFSKRLSATDSAERRIVSRASKRLIYQIFVYGGEYGYCYFDHGSVNMDDPKKLGIREFKSSFGGEIIDEYTYTYKSSAFRIFSKILMHGNFIFNQRR